MNWGLPALSLEEVSSSAASHPKLNFLLGGFNYGELPDVLGLLRQARNVFVEISCLQMRDPLETLVKLAGSSRVLFGTGLPLQYAACSLAKLGGTGLSAAVLGAVSYGNFRLLTEPRR
jgi:hypothetical protein